MVLYHNYNQRVQDLEKYNTNNTNDNIIVWDKKLMYKLANKEENELVSVTLEECPYISCAQCYASYEIG